MFGKMFGHRFQSLFLGDRFSHCTRCGIPEGAYDDDDAPGTWRHYGEEDR
jgi:hypothetical protein